MGQFRFPGGTLQTMTVLRAWVEREQDFRLMSFYRAHADITRTQGCVQHGESREQNSFCYTLNRLLVYRLVSGRHWGN